MIESSSSSAILQACRAFFLRWPYLWEIWGQESGITYSVVEKDILKFLKSAGLKEPAIAIQSLTYEFPKLEPTFSSLQQLNFDESEIKEMMVVVELDDKQEFHQARQALQELALDHRQGKNTHLLSYPGCSLLTLILHGAEQEAKLSLPRVGIPGRLLTPRYKPIPRVRIKDKKFDLTTFFSSAGVYKDQDQVAWPME